MYYAIYFIYTMILYIKIYIVCLVVVFYIIATVFQFYHGSDMMHEIRRRKLQPTLLPTQGVFNLPHHIVMVYVVYILYVVYISCMKHVYQYICGIYTTYIIYIYDVYIYNRNILITKLRVFFVGVLHHGNNKDDSAL